jgi:hypothetical protein
LGIEHLGRYHTALASMISFAVELRRSGILYEPRLS